MTDNIESALTPITRAQAMLAQATSLPELRDLRDYATTAKAWAKARGMGIGAENEATEVILRAERKIGENLILMRDEGKLAGKGDWITRPGGQGNLNKNVPAGDILRYEDIGISRQSADDYRKLAAIDDDRFEAMLASVRAIEGGRLAKANFYTAIDKAERRRSGTDGDRPTPNDHDFDLFRRGAFGLLGWEVVEAGSANVTRNGLMQLPDDELSTFAVIIRALVAAYTEVRATRAG